MVDEKSFFDQPVKNDPRTYDNIRKIATGQGDDFAAVCLLVYPYDIKYYEMITTDLNEQ